MEAQEKILIIGGTGMLGKELITLMSGIGKEVYVMTRQPEKFASLQVPGVHLIQGDLTDKESIGKACAGKDIVIATAHSLLGRGKFSSEKIDDVGHRTLIDAAYAQGIKYFQYLSVVDASPDHPVDFWRTKWKIENYLKQSGLNYNIIRSSAYMELHIAEMIGKGAIQKGKVTLFGKGENPTNFISVRDVTQLIMICMENPQHHNKTFEIGGLDHVSRTDIVNLYRTMLGKEIKISNVPGGVIKVMSKIIKPFHPGLSRVMQMSVLFERIDMKFDVRPLLKIFPIKITRIEDFIRQATEGQT